MRVAKNRKVGTRWYKVMIPPRYVGLMSSLNCILTIKLSCMSQCQLIKAIWGDATIKGICASIKEYAVTSGRETRVTQVCSNSLKRCALGLGTVNCTTSLLSRNLESWFILGKSSPFIAFIQVSESLQFTQTWLNSEDDKTVTGDGATALSHYTFVRRVYGQVSLCEYVLQPAANVTCSVRLCRESPTS